MKNKNEISEFFMPPVIIVTNHETNTHCSSFLRGSLAKWNRFKKRVDERT
jgi:hypothetical protein